MIRLCATIAWLLLTVAAAPAQIYKQLPPQGIEIDPEVHAALAKRVQQIEATLWSMNDRVADVEVLVRAVRLALDQNLFFKEDEPQQAHALLDEALERLDRFRAGERGLALMGLSKDAIDGPQLLVGGFVSRIDDSVQPFGLVVPAGYTSRRAADGPHRVDVWLHGRGDTKTEIPFLVERMTKPGQYTPSATFVLHPFGRHCNAFKFAGETDVYEAINHLETLIAVDQKRISIRGFSMGGAGCWQFAVHDAGRWMAANPGAGFVDTLVYQGWAKKSPLPLDPTRRKLLHWYDVLPWVSNLRNTNVVAYSGEVDKQRQAADRVVAAAGDAGFDFDYFIGAGMGHKIDPESAQSIDALIEAWSRSSIESPRRKIDLVTYTLRYNQIEWLQITGLTEHWTPGRVEAELTGPRSIRIRTTGITGIRLDFSDSGLFADQEIQVMIDDDRISVPDMEKDRGLNANLIWDDGWYVLDGNQPGLRKRPGLQGPIDDAFCDRFLFVIPSRPAKHGVVQRWIDREIEYAQRRWKRLMRGDVRIVLDTEVTEDQVRNNHLICFGDFTSNQYLRGVVDLLPIQWTEHRLVVGDRQWDPVTHAAVFCYPNPRNRDRYLVVNSGMTFREFSNNSNSRQIAMLPDWAVLDVADEDGMDAGGMFAGDVVADGFFNERWLLEKQSQ